ncbi:MAG: lysoplasmalogenase [Ferruginibacter sp.]
MLKCPLRKIIFVFWLLTLCDLLVIIFNEHPLHSVIKPLLMPALALALLYFPTLIGRIFIGTGLFFSWVGDIFLLLENYNSLFFIAGLVSFLLTHLCYIIYFLSIKNGLPSLLKSAPFYCILVIGYGIGLVWLLYDHLGVLKIPVMIYAAIICSMLLCSIHIYLKAGAPANCYYVAGALLFVLSDSLLAINKFFEPIPLAGIWVMLSYCAAQFLIVSGFIDKKFKSQAAV